MYLNFTLINVINSKLVAVISVIIVKFKLENGVYFYNTFAPEVFQIDFLLRKLARKRFPNIIHPQTKVSAEIDILKSEYFYLFKREAAKAAGTFSPEHQSELCNAFAKILVEHTKTNHLDESNARENDQKIS